MYGPDEHREAMVQFTAVAGKIGTAAGSIDVLRCQLHEDDAHLTSNTREHLRAAILLIARASKACQEAQRALPTPAARPDYPAAHDALHEGHR